MRALRRKAARPQPAMNVTPLVDVVLVLLIIFMVVVPAMEKSSQIGLPAIYNVDPEPKGRTDPWTLNVGVRLSRIAQFAYAQGKPENPISCQIRHCSLPLQAAPRAGGWTTAHSILRCRRGLRVRCRRDSDGFGPRAGADTIAVVTRPLAL